MRLRLLLAVVLLIVAACVPEARPTPTPEDSTASPSAAASPSDVAVETPSESVPVDPTDEPVETPTASPSDEPSEEIPSESPGEGAAACSGSDQNRDFFEDAASVLEWTVYCAVLPTGWFVNSGEYRRAGGGRLEIAYRGPGGARLELHEGAYCAAGDGCVPSGTETGDATFGDKAGTLIATDSGGWALIVDGNSQISWLAVGTGLDEDAFRALTAALAAVND
jgi:hypothetical protein